jgi:hypothetical protein
LGSPVGSGRATSRRPDALAQQKELLSHLGAEPILCDVFDREALIQAVRDFKPDVVLNELTDLPDDAAQINELADLWRSKVWNLHRTRGSNSANKRFRHGVNVNLFATHHDNRC